MSRISEKQDVQNRIIDYLQGLKWTFIPRYDLPAWRKNDEREPFLVDVLAAQLAKLNNWQPGDQRVQDMIRRLRLLPANLEGNEQFLHALRNQWTAYDAAKQREFNVTFIDYDDLEANQFHFTEEMWVQGNDRRRMDVVLFVNGLPVVLVENKSPRLRTPAWKGSSKSGDLHGQGAGIPALSHSLCSGGQPAGIWPNLEPNRQGVLPLESEQPRLRAGGAGAHFLCPGSSATLAARLYHLLSHRRRYAEVPAAAAPDSYGRRSSCAWRPAPVTWRRPTRAWSGIHRARARR